MADCFEGAGTLAGYRDANEGHAAAELRKAGFATLTYDSFAARGTTGAALQRLSGLILSGAVTRFGFVSGVGVSSMPNPRVNLTGEPYATDGPRRVLFLNEPRQPFNQIDFLDWERVSP
jgi:hypothetical protein